MKWERLDISCMDDVEVRYVTYVPVMGRMVLRQNNKGRKKGPWRIGQFGEEGHWLKPKTVKGAKAAAMRWFRSELREALKAVGG